MDKQQTVNKHYWFDIPQECYGNEKGGVDGKQACKWCGSVRSFSSSPGQIVKYIEDGGEEYPNHIYFTEGGELLFPPGESSCDGE